MAGAIEMDSLTGWKKVARVTIRLRQEQGVCMGDEMNASGSVNCHLVILFYFRSYGHRLS